MIVWSGYGFLGLLIPIVTAFLAAFLADAAMGHGYTAAHIWPMAAGTLIGAGLVYFLSVKLDRPGRLLVDPATGQRVVFKPRHTLFWIPLKWIAAIAAVIGLVMFFLPGSRNDGSPAVSSSPDQHVEVVLSPELPRG